ncbi:MAG TPA: hypothetical protein VI544_00070 [Candidatus Nanoarchaeia archaeon]|nr:hypothetical protein [Candidatus Nanoarchaeia archaeon]
MITSKKKEIVSIGSWTPRNFTLARVEVTAEYVSACTRWRL